MTRARRVNRTLGEGDVLSVRGRGSITKCKDRDAARRHTDTLRVQTLETTPTETPQDPALRDAPRRHGRFATGAKRTFDVVCAGLLVVLLSPLLLVIAVAILVSEGRPVLYRQPRVGRDGARFTMLKFRSMVPDAHEQLAELRERNQRTGPLFKLHADPRVTRVGRVIRFTSFDELPQLFNVLGGTMSMVGPRPALFEERATFPPALLERESVRPGITGLWQVEARSDPDFDRYHQLDLAYVHEWSMWLDVKLLVKTPFVIFREVYRLARHERRTAEPVAAPAVVASDGPTVHPDR
jgi:lipopolysaccharide/colanic/teichoic acid biosynthesis glycosyltransferase